MMMAAGPQGIVVRASRRIVLQARARPVIERLAQAVLAGVAHLHVEGPFAAALGNRRRAGVRAKERIITSGQWASRFGEHRGGDGSSGAWQGAENMHVTMLARLVVGGGRQLC